MFPKISVYPIEMTSYDVAGFDGTYKVINEDGLPESCDILRITNNSDVDVSISYDGVHAHDFCLLGQVLQLEAPIGRSNWAKGTKIYVDGNLQGAGDIYLAGYYRLQR